MSDILQTFKDYATYVVKSEDWENVEQYLTRVVTYKRAWRLHTVCLRRLMEEVRTPRQASIVSRLLLEWMSTDCPPSILACLHLAEQKTYERLNCTWGIKRSIFQAIASSREGRLYLKSIREQSQPGKPKRKKIPMQQSSLFVAFRKDIKP